MLVKKFPKAPLFFGSPEHHVPAVDDKVERGVDHHQQVVGRHNVGRPENEATKVQGCFALSLVLASPRDLRLSLYCHRHIIRVLASRSRCLQVNPRYKNNNVLALLLSLFSHPYLPLFCRSALGDIWKLPLLDAGSDNGSSPHGVSHCVFPSIRQPSFPRGDQYAYFFRPSAMPSTMPPSKKSSTKMLCSLQNPAKKRGKNLQRNKVICLA